MQPAVLELLEIELHGFFARALVEGSQPRELTVDIGELNLGAILDVL